MAHTQTHSAVHLRTVGVAEDDVMTRLFRANSKLVGPRSHKNIKNSTGVDKEKEKGLAKFFQCIFKGPCRSDWWRINDTNMLKVQIKTLRTGLDTTLWPAQKHKTLNCEKVLKGYTVLDALGEAELHLLIDGLKLSLGWFWTYFSTNSLICDTLPYLVFMIVFCLSNSAWCRETQVTSLSAIVAADAVVVVVRDLTWREFRTSIVIGHCVCSQCESSEKGKKTWFWKTKRSLFCSFVIFLKFCVKILILNEKFHYFSANYLHQKQTTTPTTTTTKLLCEGLELEHFSKSIVRRLKYLNWDRRATSVI